jgi:hypothetical protein
MGNQWVNFLGFAHTFYYVFDFSVFSIFAGKMGVNFYPFKIRTQSEQKKRKDSFARN